MRDRANLRAEAMDAERLAIRPLAVSGEGGGGGNDPDPGDKPTGQLDGQGSGNSPETAKPTGLEDLLASLGSYMRDPTDPEPPPDKTSQLGGGDEGGEVRS